MLTEISTEPDHIRYVVMGIGLDVNLPAKLFPAELRPLATSLSEALGRNVSRPELAAALLQELDHDYQRIQTRQFTTLAGEWEDACETLGRIVRIHVGDRTVAGRAESLDDDGALLVRTEHGRLERIVGGDVALER